MTDEERANALYDTLSVVDWRLYSDRARDLALIAAAFAEVREACEVEIADLRRKVIAKDEAIANLQQRFTRSGLNRR